MKKLLLLLAVCLTAVSCQWWHETFDSPEECAKWYIEEMVEADNLSILRRYTTILPSGRTHWVVLTCGK